MIGVGAKRKGRRDGAAVWMMRVGCGGAVVQCGWVRVAGGAPWEVRVGCGGIVNLGKLLDPTGELT